MSFFKTNTTNDNIKPTSLKNVHGGVKKLFRLFRLKKKMKQSKTE